MRASRSLRSDALQAHDCRETASEAERQAQIVEGLRWQGYIVLETSQYRPTAGADRGIPDLIVTHPGWLEGAALLLECKGAKTRLSREQKTLLEARRIFIVRNLDDANQAVAAVEQTMKETR